MTRAIVAALFTAIVILAFQVGRLSASRPATVIPAASAGAEGTEPDQWRTEAPLMSPAAPLSSPAVTPAATKRAKAKPEPTPRPKAIVRGVVSGTATWFCAAQSACTSGYDAACMCAAAGPALRQAIGKGWRGETVTVTHDGRSVRVRLVDWCLCRDDRVIDLFSSAFSRLAPLSRGVISVRVAW